MDVTLRPAAEADIAALAELALRSKGYWGYDDAFLEACRKELTLTAPRLAAERVRVAERGGRAAGYSSLALHPPHDAELMDLFVDPDHIGGGVGRTLWDDLIGHARSAGARQLRIEADPHAAAWYRRRGARPVGEVPSGSIPGRMLPLLLLEL